ncbi:MAG: GNAT family N-acetyltransferase [Flavobacteriales bacterium]|nr:GNAT family N-acetyltransferase [Flavobacteriales bacterium]MCW8914191.1 GNAT family N-acetyltransferase [Flavobacteriales bacterium]MCW8938931.1 GNAT family N-acetyltransferase [Flavobacteriales bacterium]MCW8941348.1 GNAT family N-acetyltransferase [Flavobacteriales bacterium]MCW8967994.1 GNAT family N-acetyltransferase [Flavobacteriales bacterium]
MILETERLIIRPIKLEDKDSIFEYRSDKDIYKYLGWIPETVDDVAAFINKVPKQINEPETWYQLVLIEKQTETLIGDLGIHFFGKENQQAEIGCTLNKHFQQKGYASEAIKKVIDYLFQSLNKHRVITSIDPDNKKSIRLVERMGFRKEAHFIESFYMKGKWVDDLIYAMLKKEWKK